MVVSRRSSERDRGLRSLPPFLMSSMHNASASLQKSSMKTLASIYIIITTCLAAQSSVFAARLFPPSFVSSYRRSKAANKAPAVVNLNHKHFATSHAKTPNINTLFIRGGAINTALQASPSHLLTTLVPKIGVLTSTLLYFSPFASVKRAQSTNNAGALNPLPLTIMAVSSLCWLVYGLSIQDPYVTLSNVPGCIASIWYVVTLLPLLKDTPSSLLKTQSLVVGLSATTITLWTYMSLSKKSMGQISHLLGLYASFLFIVLSGSPLSTIQTVISSKSSETILTPLTMAQVVNTALWSMYGLAIGDRFVWGPNAVGLGFGLVQLLLKLMFPDK